MNTPEQFKQILARYYRRDERTKAEHEDFIRENSEASMKKLFESLPSVERKFSLQLPDGYKAFVESACSWGLWGESNDFRIYDEEELYEFNHIGAHKGRSSFEELKDYFMFGQDTGEKSYFLDPFGRLGFGTEAVWRIDRCSCDKRDFELVAKDFHELVEKFCDKEDGDFARPFENERPESKGIIIKELLAKNVENDSRLIEKIDEMQDKIEQYFSLMKNKNIRGKIRRIRHSDIDEQKNFRLPATIGLPMEILYLIQNFFYIVSTDDFIIASLCDESLVEKNYGKYSLHILKDMFVFAFSNASRFAGRTINAMDYFFVDPTNRLGNGPEAVYIIYTKSKTLEEACLVAKDIVDLFRLLAEGAELNTTPIGKEK